MGQNDSFGSQVQNWKFDSQRANYENLYED